MAVKIKRTAGRPTKVEESLIQWGVDIASWFEEWQLMNDRVASRESIEGYYVDLSEKGTVEIGNEVDYMPYPLIGRNAGKHPPPGVIEQWIVDKGIQLVDITLKSLAFLIGRKIAREGTNQPRLKKQNIDAVINSKSVKWLNRIGEQRAEDTSVLMVEYLTKNGSFKEK